MYQLSNLYTGKLSNIPKNLSVNHLYYAYDTRELYSFTNGGSPVLIIGNDTNISIDDVIGLTNYLNNINDDIDNIYDILSTISGSTQTLGGVLFNGNTTNGTDIIISDGDKIISENNSSLFLEGDEAIITKTPFIFEITEISGTTINNVTTNLFNFTPSNDNIYNVEFNVTGINVLNNKSYGSKSFASFKVLSNIVTQISTTSIDRKSDFLPTVTSLLYTNGSDIIFDVKGRAGETIDWRANFKIIN